MNLRLVLACVAFFACPKDGPPGAPRGHEWISGIAIETLPDSAPAFVRALEAATEIAILARELGPSKGTGKEHDSERTLATTLTSLIAATSWAYCRSISSLTLVRSTTPSFDFAQYKAGYLPYSIIDGWQQIWKNFAYWRELTKAIESAAKARGSKRTAGCARRSASRHRSLVAHDGMQLEGSLWQVDADGTLDTVGRGIHPIRF